ncbi:uncharacterized protein F4807DRAFT_466537 [Annulohypoxylon truncatum]|uniref:uncharacterized protein n=1 Tax=Annulohypoxylon truncatum TaxID=327061 RepID=UPI002007F286|nr:uncharacterized protein F4807DRAFT_466537 [Annulohypoxylon truncatum]KAI1211220.1 hypothetical protein F4807DRAFT_466537 [Annulohypoxylon truncatum]
MSRITPGCYYHAVSELAKNLISTHDFFSRCLSHFTPTNARAQHPEDANPRQQLGALFWQDGFGPVAAAIKLCEPDSLTGSLDAEGLVPLFVACTVASQTIESIRMLDSQNVLASPLFRQALMVTSLESGNNTLARDIIDLEPTAPPPPETCVFKMRISPLVDKESIPAGVWAALVVKGWAPPSDKLVTWAGISTNGPDGVALLRAIVATGYDMHANPMNKQVFPQMALTSGEPEVTEYFFDLYSVTPTNDMLIQAIEIRPEGGIGNLKWLLDKHHMNVNYVRQGPGPFNRPPPTNPRERAEWDYATMLHGERQDPKTALQAAILIGNTEAKEFLLGRGALEDAGGNP